MKITANTSVPIPDAYDIEFNDEEMAAINQGLIDDPDGGFARFEKAMQGVDYDDPTALLKAFKQLAKGK